MRTPKTKAAPYAQDSKMTQDRARLAQLLVLFLSVVLTSSLTLMLVGCSGNSTGSSTDASGAANVANPVVGVEDVAAINKQLKIDLVVPENASIQNCSVIADALGEVVFMLNGQRYNYRGEITDADEDISGLYYDFTSHDEGEASGQAFIIEFSDGGPGFARWFDEASSTSYSVSVENGVSRDLLFGIATTLIEAQQS